ncbi:MAG: saccharopine dehydrogenase NADP-binding domain-containing protein, partial [Acidobacteriota bacterium]
MNILLLGAGRMGLGAAYDFAQQGDVARVTIADMNAESAHKVASVVGSPKVVPLQLDVRDHAAVVAL